MLGYPPSSADLASESMILRVPNGGQCALAESPAHLESEMDLRTALVLCMLVSELDKYFCINSEAVVAKGKCSLVSLL